MQAFPCFFARCLGDRHNELSTSPTLCDRLLIFSLPLKSQIQFLIGFFWHKLWLRFSWWNWNRLSHKKHLHFQSFFPLLTIFDSLGMIIKTFFLSCEFLIFSVLIKSSAVLPTDKLLAYNARYDEIKQTIFYGLQTVDKLQHEGEKAHHSKSFKSIMAMLIPQNYYFSNYNLLKFVVSIKKT